MTYPEIDPVAIAIGPLQVHWYGLMYLVGFGIGWVLGIWRARQPNSGWTSEQVGDLVFYCAVGVILGGRFGYVVFYNFEQFLGDPLWLLRLWEGGMSFHGGLLGVLAAFWFFARKHQKGYFQVSDFAVPLMPLGLGAGRLGNFINGELWGKPADVPWAMVFPADPQGLERHPSQLYQFALEGIALFLLLWLFSRHPKPAGSVTGLFGVGYGVFRIIAEFFRAPDAHIGYLAFGWLTMGQLLSLPVVIAGIAMMVWAYRREGGGSA